jgi:PadR family transcriptional regulator PadR
MYVEDIANQSDLSRRKGLTIMGQRDSLGVFEQLVLLAILQLGQNAYGMTIRREIEERAGRPTSIGAVYLTLDRMRQKGFVESDLGEATPERGGRAKRFFKVNPAGREMLDKSLVAVQKMALGYFPPPEAV